MMNFNRLFTLAPLFVFLVMAGCGTEGTSLLVSDEYEAEIGLEVHQQVLAEYPLFEDSTVQAWVDDIGNRLATVSQVERTGVNYRFFVLDADIVNAFAAPGGYIYLTRALILESDTEAEVAGVLGHEIGHVAHRHGVAKLERAAAAGLISDLLFGAGSIGADVINYATAFVLNTDYSQDMEMDADDQAVVNTYGAGYNPYGLVTFFETLAELSGDSMTPDWLSSHPQPQDRADRALQNIAALNAGVTPDSPGLSYELTGNFDEVRSILSY